MIIKLSPIRSDLALSVRKDGDVLVINGVSFDFSRLPDGATLPALAVGSDTVLDPVERVNGDLTITLMLPHAADAGESARFPVDIVNPANGAVTIPGQDAAESSQAVAGVIDWSQMVTAEAKAQVAAEQLLAKVVAEVARHRLVADTAIAPLQDAVDLDEATDTEAALLKEWKRYRVALNRLPEQEGYPIDIAWPAPPA